MIEYQQSELVADLTRLWNGEVYLYQTSSPLDGSSHSGYELPSNPRFESCRSTGVILDETMGRVLVPQNVWAMTGRLEIKFRKPVPLDQELTIVGELTRSRSRAYEARGEVRLPDGTLLVEGSGMYIRIPDEAIEEVKSELDFWEVVPD